MALPASAFIWAVIHTEGERPNRAVYFANLSMVTGRNDPQERFMAFKKLQADKVPRDQWDARLDSLHKRVEIQVWQILENPDGPFVRDMHLLFDCVSDQVTVRSNLQIYHHNGRNDTGPTGGPYPVKSAWTKKARYVACEEERWRAAIRADHERGGNSQAELMKQGLVLANNTATHWVSYDFAFAKLWQDGKQRELSTDKTPEELEELRKKIIAQNERASAALGGVIGSLETTLKGEDAERSFINGVAATFAKKPDLQRRTMGAQAGWTEQDVIAFWGVPQQLSEVGGSRVLVYRNESDERQTQNTVDMRSGQVIASTTTGQLRQCELSLFMRPGGKVPGPRLVDFQMRGENCNIDTLGKNRPK